MEGAVMVVPTVYCPVEEVSGEAVLGALSGGGLVLLRDNFSLADGSYEPDGAYTDLFYHGRQEVTELFYLQSFLLAIQIRPS